VLVQNSGPGPAHRPSGDRPAASPPPASSSGEVALTGQQQIVILQLTAQQVELVRFAQLDGNLSLVLRATGDKDAPPDVTTGITLFELVEKWGVLPGNFIRSLRVRSPSSREPDSRPAGARTGPKRPRHLRRPARMGRAPHR
jgi:hypothetical protein